MDKRLLMRIFPNEKQARRYSIDPLRKREGGGGHENKLLVEIETEEDAHNTRETGRERERLIGK